MMYEEDGHSINGRRSKDERPVVMLLGDSIRMGYCEVTAAALADIADTVYPTENCRSTQYTLMGLQSWASLCDPLQVVLVHFNCGHWDIARWGGDADPLTSPDEYERNLKKIIRRLRTLFPNAKLVWASTSSMNPNGSQGSNIRTNEDIEAYNAKALKVMKSEEIPVHDIYAATKALKENQFSDYCHLTPEAFRSLGEDTAGYIRRVLASDREPFPV